MSAIRSPPPMRTQPNRISAAVQQGSLWKTDRLPETFEKVRDQAVEFIVVLPEIFDLANGVNHRRVVLASEAAPDLRQRGVCERLAEIHRNLTRHGDRFRVVA